MKDKVLEQLKTQFRPEFLNRVDSFVVFRSLNVEEIRQIVDLLLARVREQLRIQQIDLEITQEAKDHIIKLGYDVDYGARPLRRVIQNMVEDPLAEALLLGRFTAGQTIVVDRSPDAGLTIEPVAEKTPVEAALARWRGPRAATSARPAAPARPRWEGRCHVCGSLGHARRDGRAAGHVAAARRRVAARSIRSARPCRSPLRERRRPARCRG